MRIDEISRFFAFSFGFNRSSFYYHPQEDPSEELLRSEIETLAGRYPRYGYRRITQLLLRMGYTVGTRRVARLMKNSNLLVTVSSVRVKQQNREVPLLIRAAIL